VYIIVLFEYAKFSQSQLQCDMVAIRYNFNYLNFHYSEKSKKNFCSLITIILTGHHSFELVFNNDVTTFSFVKIVTSKMAKQKIQCSFIYYSVAVCSLCQVASDRRQGSDILQSSSQAAICYVSNIYNSKVRHPVECLAQGHKRTCRLDLHIIFFNAER